MFIGYTRDSATPTPPSATMSDTFSLPKYLPRASPHHVQPQDSEKHEDDSGLDVILVYPESRGSDGDWPAKFRSITKSDVYCFQMRAKTSYIEKDFESDSEEVAGPLADTKPEGAFDGSSTRPVVFVAETREAGVVYVELCRPEPNIRDYMRRRIPFAGRVYGVIEMRRKSNFKSTCFFAWILWSHYNLLGYYNHCRQSTDACKAATQPKIITNPPTWFVVYAMFQFSIIFWEQYDKNRGDHYQRLCLITGITMGLLLSHSVPSTVSLATLMGTTTFAMTCSALGHLIWRKYFSKCERRLEQKLDEWKEEARRIQVCSQKDLKPECEAQKPHFPKFHALD